MSTFTINATSRKDTGKGASRRLRREGNIPAIVYGGKAEPVSLTLSEREVNKATLEEAFFSSVVELIIDGEKTQAVVMDVQRHQYKPVITHMDFERVTADTIVDKKVPLHFINEDKSAGVKAGGVISHNITELEIKCPAGKLPEFIEVDMTAVEVGQVVHISDIALPEGAVAVELQHGESHDLPVVSINAPKGAATADEGEEAAE
ncbi:50S ribosomal protein L25/general stress protein Ctc [Salinibius halmophilus]|uniref:50S ribosomal protein L25/general stress protein Ctc n=1 Tax=Salinibius halmophilus TaxID=1853216 RepID=UPI000E66AD15|nr:50S ribosomal protein L25/general stress protein Ctc [Salinibius halmophilus]